MTDDQRKAMREPVRHLGADIGENHYRAAHEAAEAIVSGVYEMIPVDVHDLVHEAALAGYATALSDLEEGKLDDRVRARLEEVVPTRSLNEGAG